LNVYEIFSDLVERYIAGRNILNYFGASYVIAMAVSAHDKFCFGDVNA
jgi:hypothetical protein